MNANVNSGTKNILNVIESTQHVCVMNIWKRYTIQNRMLFQLISLYLTLTCEHTEVSWYVYYSYYDVKSVCEFLMGIFVYFIGLTHENTVWSSLVKKQKKNDVLAKKYSFVFSTELGVSFIIFIYISIFIFSKVKNFQNTL